MFQTKIGLWDFFVSKSPTLLALNGKLMKRKEKLFGGKWQTDAGSVWKHLFFFIAILYPKLIYQIADKGGEKVSQKPGNR